MSSSSTRKRPGPSVPLGPEEVEEWFDPDGRLVKEAAMRKALFEVGVAPSCRRKIFKFLYNVYPANSTTRDRKTIDIENRANYIALRRRWEVMDKTITFPDEELLDSPWYMDFSDDEEGDDSNSRLAPASPAPPPLNAESANHDDSRKRQGVNLTESRDSGNFTEGSLETSSEACALSSCDSRSNSHVLYEACSSCGRVLQRAERERGVVVADKQMDNGPSSEGCAESNADRRNCETGKGRQKGDIKCKLCCNGGTEFEVESSSGSTSASNDESTRCECGRGRRFSTSGLLDQEGQALLNILEFPSKVFAARLPVDLEKSYKRAKRIILRDVSRTDRNYHFFSHKRNLRKVHRILMIYSLFHPDIGYAQGMNDILARFLVMTGSEVDSYCLFKCYMDKKREDFLEDTMMRKVGLVKNLIMELDSELYDFYEGSECRDYLFCHRWLLLDFKREFPFEESLRIFEVLSSHYLELNSDKARVETDKVIAKEFELDGGQMRSKRSSVNLGFTFDLFVCAAILTLSNDIITKGTDAATVYGFLNSLSMSLDLEKVLSQAEELFYTYCKLTVTRGFSDIEI